MFTAALVIITLICFLLILVVLIQNSKGGGAMGGFGTSSASLIGVKRTSDLLENITWGLAITLLVGCLATNFIIDRNEDGSAETEVNSVNVERAQESGAVAPPQQQAPQPQENK